MTALQNPATHCRACGRHDAQDRCLHDCPKCEGTGRITEDHPRWGRIDCPEPTVSEECWACSGKGLLPVVQCATCRRDLEHSDPTWVALIEDGQSYPTCQACAIAAGFHPEGVRHG